MYLCEFAGVRWCLGLVAHLFKKFNVIFKFFNVRFILVSLIICFHIHWHVYFSDQIHHKQHSDFGNNRSRRGIAALKHGHDGAEAWPSAHPTAASETRQWLSVHNLDHHAQPAIARHRHRFIRSLYAPYDDDHTLASSNASDLRSVCWLFAHSDRHQSNDVPTPLAPCALSTSCLPPIGAAHFQFTFTYCTRIKCSHLDHCYIFNTFAFSNQTTFAPTYAAQPVVARSTQRHGRLASPLVASATFLSDHIIGQPKSNATTGRHLAYRSIAHHYNDLVGCQHVDRAFHRGWRIHHKNGRRRPTTTDGSPSATHTGCRAPSATDTGHTQHHGG